MTCRTESRAVSAGLTSGGRRRTFAYAVGSLAYAALADEAVSTRARIDRPRSAEVGVNRIAVMSYRPAGFVAVENPCPDAAIRLISVLPRRFATLGELAFGCARTLRHTNDIGYSGFAAGMRRGVARRP